MNWTKRSKTIIKNMQSVVLHPNQFSNWEIIQLILIQMLIKFCSESEGFCITMKTVIIVFDWLRINSFLVVKATLQQLIKGESKKWAGFDRQWPISLKGAGIQNSWRSMKNEKKEQYEKMKNKVGLTSSTILNSCSFRR